MPSKILSDLASKISPIEGKIVHELGTSILRIGDIEVMTGIKKPTTSCYDLAFKSLNKKYKPTFCAFVTHTLKAQNGWNINPVEDTIMVQVRFKGITDPKNIDNPDHWNIFFTKKVDAKKGWFNFIVDNDSNYTISYSLKLIAAAFKSF